MAKPVVSQPVFIRMIQEHGPEKTAKLLGVSAVSVFKRRRNIERNTGIQIDPPNPRKALLGASLFIKAGIDLRVRNGAVIIGSDAHYWPGIVSTAHRAFVKFCSDLQPKAIIMNGDAMDFPGLSRHAPIMWEERPEVVKEIETVQERLAELHKAAPNAKRFFPFGNHDGRFESRLAAIAPEYARVHGVHLKDHLPFWHPCWSVYINDDVVVKHRYKGGIHAAHNNTKDAGRTMITGHLHSLKVAPYSDFNGTRFGVDCGTLADPYGPQFGYMEENPRNWRSGFVVLFFENGELRWPQLVHVVRDGVVEFQGKTMKV